VRNTEEGARRCQINDAEGGRVSGETGKPYAYECHAGLIDFAVPIIVDGRQIGSWLGGQVLTHAPDIANTRKIAREIGVDPDQLVRAIRKIPVLSREKIDQSMELLSLLAKTMSRLGNDQRLWTVMTDLVESGTGTNIMNSIREKLDLFIQTEIEHMQTIEARANSTATTTKFIILAAVFVAMIIGILVSLVILRSITGPVIQAMDLAERLGRGDFSRRLNLRQKDEIGRLSESLDSMADILEKHENELKENLDTMHAILTQVGDIAVNAHGNARALADSGQTLSQAATEQASSLEEISSSLTEIGGQTKTSADNAQAASALSEQSHNAADAGTSRMNQMVDAMGDIFEASRNIAKITKVIDEIAFQTNLLSLNAAVEAARAGQHGKGFAVVAEEVRNLAVRSARAAHEISDLIENSVGKVENGNRIASETAEALADIVEATAKTAAIVKEISMASKEQATGIEQITEGLSQVDGVTHLVTSTAEETASASEELTGIAGKLREILQRYEKGSPQAAIDAPETPDEMIRLLPASAPERWEEQTGS
jgi:methyl-accepting chemotaxis protein